MGPDEVTRAVSCERHWGFSVERNAKKLIGEDVQKEYFFLCDAVLKATTVNMYEKAREQLVSFTDNHPFLSSWWKWWESRRSYNFRAFKPGLNVPEVHHFRWNHIGAENLILIQACREDVAESLKLKRRLEGYRKGAYKGGFDSRSTLWMKLLLIAMILSERGYKRSQDLALPQLRKEMRKSVVTKCTFVHLKALWMKSLLTDTILLEKQAEWKKGLPPQLRNQILTNVSPRKETHGVASSSVP
ncbi:hypothetical protein ACROYT_G013840 [Oculina patagonica]